MGMTMALDVALTVVVTGGSGAGADRAGGEEMADDDPVKLWEYLEERFGDDRESALKELRATIDRLLAKGVIVDSGRRRNGQPVWVLSEQAQLERDAKSTKQ